MTSVDGRTMNRRDHQKKRGVQDRSDTVAIPIGTLSSHGLSQSPRTHLKSV